MSLLLLSVPCVLHSPYNVIESIHMHTYSLSLYIYIHICRYVCPKRLHSRSCLKASFAKAQEVLADSPVTVAARGAQRSQVQSVGAVVGVRVGGVGGVVQGLRDFAQ